MLAQLWRALSLVSELSPPGHPLIVCGMTAVLFAGSFAGEVTQHIHYRAPARAAGAKGLSAFSRSL